VADPIISGGPGRGDSRRRFLALGGAAVLVLVAVAVRGRIDDGGGSGGEGGGGERTLICASELEDVCQAAAAADADLRVRMQDALDTADALIAATSTDDVEGDLWLVTSPFAEAVAAERDRTRQAPITGDATGPIARSPVMLALFSERADALAAAECAGEIDWVCVGEATGRQWSSVGGEAAWGTVKAGLVDPTSASGLPVLGAATAGYLGTGDYFTNDVSGDVLNWLGAFAGYPADTNAVDAMLTQGPGVYFAVGALEATARKAVDRPGYQAVVPEPLAVADLVVVPIGADGDDGGAAGAATDLAGDDALLDALAESGWRVEGRDLAAGIDPDLELPDDDGLPSGDVLLPLLQSWQGL
jgi:hypothetical protein